MRIPIERLKELRAQGKIQFEDSDLCEALHGEKQPDEQKHTPGPWFVSDKFSKGDKLKVAIAPDGISPICDVYKLFISSKAEAHANANLIAAAPELLAACKSARGALEIIASEENWTPTPGSTIMQLQNAIAKAEGRD